MSKYQSVDRMMLERQWKVIGRASATVSVKRKYAQSISI